MPLFDYITNYNHSSSSFQILINTTIIPFLSYNFSKYEPIRYEQIMHYTWMAFPIAETATGLVGVIMYIILIRDWKKENKISGNVC